jgi:hypothetical protein
MSKKLDHLVIKAFRKDIIAVSGNKTKRCYLYDTHDDFWESLADLKYEFD